MNTKIPSHRNSKVCKTRFKPETIFQWWCCEEHKADFAVQVYRKQSDQRTKSQQRSLEKEQKEKKAEWRERKAAIKPLKHWEEMTQRAVNDYITKGRDAAEPCISCGTWETVQWEAGHYRSIGAASHLRYEEDNIHKQCHRCNCELSSNAVQYRISLVEKIGLERVLELENNNTPHRYTREELSGIRASSRAKLRDMKKHQEAA